jgi:hypothetical protein
MGTLLGLPRPPAQAAPAALGGAPARAQAPPGGELERHIEGLRLELASFREWLPRQLVRPRYRPGPAALAAPAPPRLPTQGPGAHRRELQSPALVAGAGALLALALAFASASAALSWPPYARLVARLGGAPTHSR